MSITQEIRAILNDYENVEGENRNHNDVEDVSLGGLCIDMGNNDLPIQHRNFRNSQLGALTYSDEAHSFFVEPLFTVIPYSSLKYIIDNYSALKENNNYSNIIPDSYNNTQLITDIDSNWDYHVLNRISSLLDMAKHLFDRYFNIQLDSYYGTNMFFYSDEIARIIDDEARYKQHEKDNFEKAIESAKQVKAEFENLSSSYIGNDKELENNILKLVFRLYDKNYYEFKEWASEKSGYAIGGHIAVYNSDWSTIVDAWKTIKIKRPDIFKNSRFAPNPSYSKSYSNTIRTFDTYIDNLFSTANIEQALIDLSKGVYATFYGKNINA